MPTTSQGIWYPGGGDDLNPLQAVFSTQAASVDTNMGVRLFATNSKRDLAYDKKPFKLCVVGSDVASGTLYKRSGNNWVSL